MISDRHEEPPDRSASLWACQRCAHEVDEHLVIRPDEPEQRIPCRAMTPVGRCGCTELVIGPPVELVEIRRVSPAP